MVTINAGRAGLAVALALGGLLEAVSGQPAKASYVAFGNTASGSQLGTASNKATLDLLEDGIWVFVTTQFQGWVATGGPTGYNSPSGANTSYTAGYTTSSVYGPIYTADYFGFNLAGPVCEVSNPGDCFTLPSTTKVTQANLVIYSGTISNKLNYSLFGATTWLSDINTTTSDNAALYADLVTTNTNSYGTFAIAPTSSPSTVLTFGLTGSALSDINTALAGQKNQKAPFVIAGKVSPVPEPSTWVMILAGFAGLGVIARRRAARCRAAA
jgi:PEP-CTERM motif